MLIDVDQAQDAMVEEEHVEIAAGRPERAAKPRRTPIAQLLAPEVLHAPELRAPSPDPLRNTRGDKVCRSGGRTRLRPLQAHSSTHHPGQEHHSWMTWRAR